MKLKKIIKKKKSKLTGLTRQTRLTRQTYNPYYENVIIKQKKYIILKDKIKQKKTLVEKISKKKKSKLKHYSFYKKRYSKTLIFQLMVNIKRIGNDVKYYMFQSYTRCYAARDAARLWHACALLWFCRKNHKKIKIKSYGEKLLRSTMFSRKKLQS